MLPFERANGVAITVVGLAYRTVDGFPVLAVVGLVGGTVVGGEGPTAWNESNF